MILFLETIHEHSLTIDFSMFLLIWIVQLIIYPSFFHVSTDKFKAWHRTYCNRVSVFVLPLMLLQMIECVCSCFFESQTLNWVRLSTVLLAWSITFLHSAKKHKKLSLMGKDPDVLASLTNWNWLRTFLWSSTFISSFLLY